MNTIEFLRLCQCQLDALGGNNPQAGVLEFGNDLAGQVAFGGIGFDDAECALNGHDGLFLFMRQAPARP